MSQLKITLGEWKVHPYRAQGRYKKEIDVGPSGIAVCTIHGEFGKEEAGEKAESDARLIAEAGTVANECGLMPRELLEQRDMLLEALEEAGYHLDYCNYGDKWENECARDVSLPEKISLAIARARGRS